MCFRQAWSSRPPVSISAELAIARTEYDCTNLGKDGSHIRNHCVSTTFDGLVVDDLGDNVLNDIDPFVALRGTIRLELDRNIGRVLKPYPSITSDQRSGAFLHDIEDGIAISRARSRDEQLPEPIDFRRSFHTDAC